MIRRLLFLLILVVFSSACARVEIRYYSSPEVQQRVKEMQEEWPLRW